MSTTLKIFEVKLLTSRIDKPKKIICCWLQQTVLGTRKLKEWTHAAPWQVLKSQVCCKRWDTHSGHIFWKEWKWEELNPSNEAWTLQTRNLYAENLFPSMNSYSENSAIRGKEAKESEPYIVQLQKEASSIPSVSFPPTHTYTSTGTCI